MYGFGSINFVKRSFYRSANAIFAVSENCAKSDS